ncbi:MAG: hypothetical protein GC165_18295 [Armatimonadetes bacterium]|nr:hypothetical protein [Armatimonadota bacterium]
MRKRGTTLVEMLFTMTLMVVTMGAAVTLYAFVAARTGDSITQYNVFQQTNGLMKSMAKTASNAIKCESITLGSVTALKCTMPDSGTDYDNDGIIDEYQPTGVYKTLRAYYSPGKRIWYFPSTNPIRVGNVGSFWYRGIVTDDTTVTSSNVDKAWTYPVGTKAGIYIPGSVTFTQDATNLATTITIKTDTTSTPNRSVSGYSGNNALPIPDITMTRTCFWKAGK